MTTATTPEEVRALADACASDWHAVRPHLVVDALHCLQADNEAMRETLEFVERWAVHHASKPHMTAELALGSIQHHPEIRAITERYADGKRPDTFDPYARIAELEGKVGRFQGVPLPLIEAINAATGSNDWQGDHSPAELLEPACRAITALRAERPMPTVEDASQEWGKVDPITAWHLIERHADNWADIGKMMTEYVQAQIARAELEARKPLPLSDDDRLRLRSDVARAIWDVMREHEDRCDHALEDVGPKHQVWDCADAAIRAMKVKP